MAKDIIVEAEPPKKKVIQPRQPQVVRVVTNRYLYQQQDDPWENNIPSLASLFFGSIIILMILLAILGSRL